MFFFLFLQLNKNIKSLISKVLTNFLNQNPMLQNSRSGIWLGKCNSLQNQCCTKTKKQNKNTDILYKYRFLGVKTDSLHYATTSVVVGKLLCKSKLNMCSYWAKDSLKQSSYHQKIKGQGGMSNLWSNALYIRCVPN